MNPTFASFLDPTGLIVAAGLITALVQLGKAVFPPLDARVSGALQAFVLSAVLYALTAVAVGVPTLDAGLLVFCAWLACATSAVGAYATITHVATTRSE